MSRVSQAQAQENRRRVVETAARLFREQGTAVSVVDVMQAAGLTHGGFYKQFASKDALIGEAAAYAFDEQAKRRALTLEDSGGERIAAQQAVINSYLSPRHRDNPAEGCPAAALAGEIGRTGEHSEGRKAYIDGVEELIKWFATEDDDADGIARLSSMVGALVLARATNGSELSDRILDSVRTLLTSSSSSSSYSS
ncbi:TetR/AcrR family transcriptional regulator [Streptomyces sp. NPDC059629]|uniref:TetR/AcrR family transcriptional regulator n=1 Tax=Streptomyces sp. NPDC059629 TaxID=3346889 RepID=UPI0036C0E654